jgi:hypothetical protein
MTSVRIFRKGDAWKKKWTELTDWVLKKKLLRFRAALHSMKLTAGKAFTMAVDRLLMDVLKKLAHIHRRYEDLNVSSEPVSKLSAKSVKLNPKIKLIIIQVIPDW